jgi:hypothetical protein
LGGAEDSLQQSLAVDETLGQHGRTGELPATLAYVDRRRGRREQARGHLCAALRMMIENRDRNAALHSLPAMALLLMDDEGAQERAIELYALASRYPYVANSRWFEDVAGREIAAAAAKMSPDVAAAAQERGRARDLWETVEELLEELAET